VAIGAYEDGTGRLDPVQLAEVEFRYETASVVNVVGLHPDWDFRIAGS
jgi:hypothetical protein